MKQNVLYLKINIALDSFIQLTCGHMLATGGMKGIRPVLARKEFTV